MSHYDLSRTFRVMFDLITIRFLLRYMTRPLHFFGRLGLINMGLGSTVALWLLIWKIVAGIDVVQQHGLLLVFAAVLILAGLQLMALGLLGELQVWQYFNPSARRPYAVSDVVEARSVARASTVGVGLDDRNGVARKEKGHEGAPTLHPSADLSEQDLEIHEQAVEQAITELGEDASLNDVVARVRSIKDALAQSPARRKGEPLW